MKEDHKYKQSSSVTQLEQAKFAEQKKRANEALKAKASFFQQNQNHLCFIQCSQNLYFGQNLNKKLKDNTFNVHSVIDSKDTDRLSFSKIFAKMKSDKNYDPKQLKLESKISKGVGSVMGMAIADALGASTQFEHFKKQGMGIVKQSFYDIHAAIMLNKLRPRSGTVGIWTDDASMGLCMADSLLLTDYFFNPEHLRYMFTLWLDHGLNNGGRSYSIGLGGNISISMREFMINQLDYTYKGDQFNNGNGSLMRLAPIPVAFSNDIQKGILYSGLQSMTTHNGAEARQCSRLMANIIIELINREESQDGKQLLLKVCDSFESPVKSVQFLAKGQKQSQELYKEQYKNEKFRMFNKTINDRNWNWRDASHTYSPTRLKNMPGYIGSYCMDALSMALHTVMFSHSFLEVACKNADMGGDCDTVGSIACQIAGALYGVDESMLKLYSEMEDFKCERYEVFLKGYKLATKQKLVLIAKESK